MQRLSIIQGTEKCGFSARRVSVLCFERRIGGVTKIGSYRAVPATAENQRMEGSKSKKYKKYSRREEAWIVNLLHN